MKIKPIYIKLSYQAAMKIQSRYVPFNGTDHATLINCSIVALACLMLMDAVDPSGSAYTLLFIIGIIHIGMGLLHCICKIVLEWYYRSALKCIELHNHSQTHKENENVKR